jgi:hypothetical protein
MAGAEVALRQQDLGANLVTVIDCAASLSFVLQAVVDVVASSGWLHPALAAMEMCQMVVQGQWEKDSPLLQLPHITPQLAAAAAAKDISTVFDLIEMDGEERRELLQVRTGLKATVSLQLPVVGLSLVAGRSVHQGAASQGRRVVLQQGPCSCHGASCYGRRSSSLCVTPTLVLLWGKSCLCNAHASSGGSC